MDFLDPGPIFPEESTEGSAFHGLLETDSDTETQEESNKKPRQPVRAEDFCMVWVSDDESDSDEEASSSFGSVVPLPPPLPSENQIAPTVSGGQPTSSSTTPEGDGNGNARVNLMGGAWEEWDDESSY